MNEDVAYARNTESGCKILIFLNFLILFFTNSFIRWYGDINNSALFLLFIHNYNVRSSGFNDMITLYVCVPQWFNLIVLTYTVSCLFVPLILLFQMIFLTQLPMNYFGIVVMSLFVSPLGQLFTLTVWLTFSLFSPHSLHNGDSTILSIWYFT